MTTTDRRSLMRRANSTQLQRGEAISTLNDYLDTVGATRRLLKDWTIWEHKQRASEVAKKEIEDISEDMLSLPSASSDGVRVSGGESGVAANRRLCGLIDRKAALADSITKADSYFAELLPAWEQLTDDERYLLEQLYVYYDEDIKGRVEAVCQKYFISASQAYRRGQKALKKLSKMIYW